MSVHNHPPYRPMCAERQTLDGLKGACMSDVETIRDQATIRNLPDDDETVTRVVQRVHAALNSGRDAAVVKVVLDETETLRDELALVNDTLTRRSAAHDRLVATIQRVRATLRLIAPDEITPQGARMLQAALDPQ
jgi:hypothetical protein